MKSLLFKIFVGKNAPALGRALAQFIVGAILASVLYAWHGSALPESPIPGADPALVEAFDATAPSADEIRDGLDMQETVKVVMAFFILWVSRLTSFLRARNLDWLAQMIGWIIGRSIPSLFRCLMDVASGGLLYIGIAKADAPQATLVSVISAMVLWIASRISSAIEDGKRNPVPLAFDPLDADPFRQ